MRFFDLEAAKAGHPVCTENGNSVEILDFNDTHDPTHPIKAKICYDNSTGYAIKYYKKDGTSYFDDVPTLYMKSLSGEGWINIYDSEYGFITGKRVWSSEKRAKENIIPNNNYVKTIKIII